MLYSVMSNARTHGDQPGDVHARRMVGWRHCREAGQQVLSLSTDGGILLAEGVIVSTSEPPFGGTYRILIDSLWRVRAVSVSISGGARLELRSDGEGGWTDLGGMPLPNLAGALDVDLQATPFTNTLPIRRLGLATGSGSEVSVVYVSMPALEVDLRQQRYTRLGVRSYRYESLASGFSCELNVDEDGLIQDYPGLFSRAF